MDQYSIASAGGDFLADYGADIVPVLMKDGFPQGENTAWRIRRTFRSGKRRVRFRLFAHERGQVHEHRVMALGAADPQVLWDRLLGGAVDGLRFLTGHAGTGFANDFFAGRAGTLGTEHQSGDVFGAPPCARSGSFRRCFRRQCYSMDSFPELPSLNIARYHRIIPRPYFSREEMPVVPQQNPRKFRVLLNTLQQPNRSIWMEFGTWKPGSYPRKNFG